jgi:Protein of unknown function (DUF3311)
MLQPRSENERRRSARSLWHLLLIVPVMAPLLTPMINRAEPTFLGLPFFYWSQFAYVIVTMIITFVVHHLTKSRR